MKTMTYSLFVLTFGLFAFKAYAIDLSGSYEGTMSCTTLTFEGETIRQTIPAFAHISQEAINNSETWYQMHYVYGFQGGGPGYKASHLVSAYDTTAGNSNNNLETGMVSAIQCGTTTGPIQHSITFNRFEFGVGDYTILPTGKTSIDFTYYRYFITPSNCKLSLTRNKTDDPIVTREGPIPGFSVPQEYTCGDRPF